MQHTRTIEDAIVAKRGAGISLLHANIRQPGSLTTSALFRWALSYLSVALAPRRTLPQYEDGETGIYTFKGPTKVALASDWGTGTPNAYKVIDNIRDWGPDYAIHLGDIYYVGKEDEVQRYFLGPNGWPCGESVRSFALNGNHEMYSGGGGYFGEVFKALGQTASWFCIESEYWRIVALDTGYWCKTLPFLELLFSTRLPNENIDWLRTTVFNDPADTRPVILLSHHQPYSAFEGRMGKYERVRKEVSDHVPNIALWLWGHEHRFAVYGKCGTEPGLVRGRCIGHGGMPVDVKGGPKEGDAKRFGLAAYDNRRNPSVSLPDIGFCGYCRLLFDDGHLTIEYRDEDNALMLTEEWESNRATATGIRIAKAPRLTTRYGVALESAIA